MKSLPTAFSVALLLALSLPAPALEPVPGEVRTLPVVSVSLAVGGTEKDSKRVAYSPPPGWYIRSHRVVCERRYGMVTYAVNTVPAGWDYITDERTMATSRTAASAALSANQGWAGGKASTAHDASSAGRQANASSHHALVVDVTARGEGLLLGGSGIELTVFAEMVYLGTEPSPTPSGAAARLRSIMPLSALPAPAAGQTSWRPSLSVPSLAR